MQGTNELNTLNFVLNSRVNESKDGYHHLLSSDAKPHHQKHKIKSEEQEITGCRPLQISEAPPVKASREPFNPNRYAKSMEQDSGLRAVHTLVDRLFRRSGCGGPSFPVDESCRWILTV
jgi:hypothetical protein